MPSRRQVLASVGVGVSAGLAGCSARTRVSGSWPRAGYDDQSTGHAPGVDAPTASLTKRWTVSIPESVHAPSPVLAGDELFVTYATPRTDAPRVGVRALDAETGETVRDVTVTSYGDAYPDGALVWDSLAHADDLLVLVAYDGVHAVTTGGERRWHAPFDGAPANSIHRWGHPVVAAGRVFAPTASATMHTDTREGVLAVDAETGDVAWRYRVPVDSYGWTYAPAYRAGVLYVAALDYGVVALDAETGDERWVAEFTAAGPAAVADGRVYVAGEDRNAGHVVCLDADTGETVWRATGAGERIGRRVAVANGRVVCREGLGALVARDAASGVERWRYAGASTVDLGGPTVAGDAVYVGVQTGGADDSAVAVLDAATGRPHGFARIGADTGLQSAVALADGAVFASTSAGSVVAFSSCALPVAGRCLR